MNCRPHCASRRVPRWCGARSNCSRFQSPPAAPTACCASVSTVTGWPSQRSASLAAAGVAEQRAPAASQPASRWRASVPASGRQVAPSASLAASQQMPSASPSARKKCSCGGVALPPSVGASAGTARSTVRPAACSAASCAVSQGRDTTATQAGWPAGGRGCSARCSASSSSSSCSSSMPPSAARRRLAGALGRTGRCQLSRVGGSSATTVSARGSCAAGAWPLLWAVTPSALKA